MTPGKRGMTGKHSNHWKRPRVRVSVTCEVCGMVRQYTPSQARQRTGRFCSQKCKGMSTSTRVPMPCAQCGTETLKRQTHAQTHDAAYCSPQCAQAGKRRDGAKWRDPQQIADYMRQYTVRNRERVNAMSREWMRTHRDKRNELQRARRAAGKASDFTASDWLSIKRQYGFRCLACGRLESLLVVLQPDHVVSVARGGPHHRDNIQPLCRECNIRKSAKCIDYRSAARH